MRRWIEAVLVMAVTAVGCDGRKASPAPTASPTPAPTGGEASALARFDVFGSKQVDRATVIAALRRPVTAFVEAAAGGKDTDAARAEVIAGVRRLGAFAYVDLSSVTYFGGAQSGTFVTLDLVDEADRSTRMAFAPAPTGQVPDPDGLLALWGEYEGKMWPVVNAAGGKTDTACPAWHCITFDDPTLVPYRDAFEGRVPAHEAELARVLHEDADEFDRAWAAFLLAHADDGARVVAAEVASFRDPSSLVRNNAMRVVALIAANHPEVEIPLAPVLQAVRFPSTTDRNKALAILSGMARQATTATRIIDEAGPLLVEILHLTQPNNHDYAHAILKAASGQAYGARDYAAWEAWLASR